MINKTLGALALIALSAPVFAQKGSLAQPIFNGGTVSVTITNVSKTQFTPILAATHNSEIAFFQAGAPASDELALLAEGGDIGPLSAVLEGSDDVGSQGSSAGLLMPGQSVTIELDGDRNFDRLSLAAMLLPTNDAFVALNGVGVPRVLDRPMRYVAFGYDAGSEPNDELCANIPGPTCGGAGPSPEAGGEGYVSISAGIQGNGDLNPVQYDWR
ncbi:MAG: spondin domain-containing protein, partial [Pseudomonadota bacterium]